MIVPAEWSDGATTATTSDQGMTINGALVPWSTLSIMANVGNGARLPFTAFVQQHAAIRKPDGSMMTPGDRLELLGMLEPTLDQMRAAAGNHISDVTAGAVVAMADELRGQWVDESLAAEGLPTEDAVEPTGEPT